MATPPKSTNSEVMQLTYTNAGFYNPVPPPPSTESSSFPNNGFSSFLGANMPFNIENINAALFNTSQSSVSSQSGTANETATTDIYNSNSSISSLFSALTQPPPPPDPVPTPMPVAAPLSSDYQFNTQQVPLMPPPVPPFSKPDVIYNSNSYSGSYSTDSSTNFGNSNYNQSSNSYTHAPISFPSSAPPYQSTQSRPSPNFQTQNSYPPSSNFPPPTPTNNFDGPPMSNFPNTFVPPPPPAGQNYISNDEYNPEEEPETWDNDGVWEPPPVDLETPESPPNFEKESYSAPVEYHDNQTMGTGIDIDHRMLSIMGANNNSESESNHRKKDVDHRNLISLTGSPKENPSKIWKLEGDQDYRTRKQMDSGDQDYRMFNFENLQLPPPPPPPNQISPNKLLKKHGQSPRKAQDNVESIDMDLSDDDNNHDGVNASVKDAINDNLKVVTLIDEDKLEPPPPFPEFSDEADANANNLLDDLNNDLDETDDLISALGQQPPLQQREADMMDGPIFEMNNIDRVWNNRIPPVNMMADVGPPAFPINGPPQNIRNGPPDIMLAPWPEFIDFRGRGNKRGNFNNRGDFRGRPPMTGGRGARRGRGGNFRGNRGINHNQRGGVLQGTARSRPPFFRGRFRGGY
ncbi:hypothetical protein QE152_g16083 [Popillia japonica]|uniref:Uncharacterized protein n=1 Tax=Popillia japonica TaxID=7064 RepID=A0AAW1L657_POPJA